MKLLTREQARKIDQTAIHELGIPGVDLMENAGAKTAELFLSLNPQKTDNIIICCGKGNNGGDGYVIARYLLNAGFSIKIFLFAEPAEITGDAKIHFDVIKKLPIPITIFSAATVALQTQLQTADWIIDALFGTGLIGTVRTPYAEIIQAINNTKAPILAVDIPSGLDCDTGQPLGIAVHAHHTATFVGMKKGFVQPAAKEYVGQVHVMDIGIPSLWLSH